MAAVSSQVREMVLAHIRDELLRPGDRLPPERAFALAWDVSRASVRAAIAQLTDDGVLTVRQGAGTFVAPPKVERNLWDLRSLAESAREAGRELRTEVIDMRVVPADERTADLLDLAAGADVLSLRRLRIIDDVPAAVETSMLGLSRFESLDAVDFGARGLYETLADDYDTVVTSGHQRLGIDAIGPEIAEHLDLAETSRIFHVTGTASDESGRPIERFESWLRPDSIRFISDLQNIEEAV